MAISSHTCCSTGLAVLYSNDVIYREQTEFRGQLMIVVTCCHSDVAKQRNFLMLFGLMMIGLMIATTIVAYKIWLGIPSHKLFFYFSYLIIL